MALKKGRAPKLSAGVKSVAKGVQPDVKDSHDGVVRSRTKAPLPSEGNVVEASESGGNSRRKATEYETITISGSKGQKYRVAVPVSYLKAIPKVWEWNAERYRVAELIAEGVPIANIPNHPDVSIKSRITIYGWLEHPEFKEHVDALVLETGWASRRERINNLSHLNRVLLNKVANEIDSVKLTDKSLGAVLSALQASAKLIAQEKGEFVEESKVTQDTNITGAITNVTAKLEDFMASKTEDERKSLEQEFDNMGDDIIRSLTGDKN
jgi:hypothetical protein